MTKENQKFAQIKRNLNITIEDNSLDSWDAYGDKKEKKTSIVNTIKSKYVRVTLHLFSDTLNFRWLLFIQAGPGSWYPTWQLELSFEIFTNSTSPKYGSSDGRAG